MTEPATRARPKLRRPAPVLREQVEASERDERRRARLALLRRPLLTAYGDDAEAFVLVRRHAAWLGEWLAHQAGWSLVVNAESGAAVRFHVKIRSLERKLYTAAKAEPTRHFHQL